MVKIKSNNDLIGKTIPEAGISALILAAGNSERMGRDKASLPYGNGLTFAGQLISAYSQAGCNPIIMVVNNRVNPAIPDPGKVQFVLNDHVEKGRSLVPLARAAEHPRQVLLFHSEYR